MFRRLLYNLVPALVPVAILLVAGARLISQRSAWVRQQLPHVIRAELWSRTGRQVRVGPVEGDLLRGMTVHDIAVAQPAGFEDGTALSTDEVRIRYNLGKLVRGKVGPLGSIGELTIVGPAIAMTRARDGTIDLVEMFAPKEPRPPGPDRLTVPVQVSGARLSYTDLALPTRSGLPFSVRLAGVDGAVDMRREGQTSVTLSGVNPDGVAGSVRGEVQYGSSPATFFVKAQIDDAAIGHFLDLAPTTSRVGVGGGRADVRGIVYGVRNDDGQWKTNYNLGADVSGARVTLPQLGGQRLTVNGRASLTPETLLISRATATSEIGRVTASGAVLDLRGVPYLDLLVSADAVDVAGVLAPLELPEGVPAFAVHGDATADDVVIRGSIPHLDVSGTINLPGGHVAGEQFGLGGLLVGPVEAAVEIRDLAEPRLVVDGDIADLSTETEAGTVWEALPLEFGTIGAAKVEGATLTWSRADGVDVAGTVKGLAAPDVSLTGGECSFHATPAGVSFDASAGLLEGGAEVHGTYSASAPEDTEPPAAGGGTLHLTGTLTGLDAEKIGQLPWRESVDDGPDEPADDEETGEEKASLRTAIAKLQAGGVTVGFDITYDGTGANGQLIASTTDLRYDEQDVPDADLTAALTARRVDRNGKEVWMPADGHMALYAHDERGDAWLTATLGPAGAGDDADDDEAHVEAAVGATGIDVAAIAAVFGQEDVGGWGRVSGWASGTWHQGTDRWSIADSSLAARVDEPEYGEYALDFVEVELGGNLDRMEVREGRAGRGDAEVVLGGDVREIDIDKKDARLDLQATTRDSSVAEWLSLAKVEQDVEGLCTVEADVTGTLAAPHVSGDIHIADATAYDLPVHPADAHFEYTDDTLHIRDIEAWSEEAELRGELTVSALREAPRITAPFRATGVDAARVRAVAEAGLPVRAVLSGWGLVKATQSEAGEWETNATVHVNGEDVAIAGHPVWDLAATATYADDKVVVKEAGCRVFGGRVSADGEYGVEDGGVVAHATIDDARTWLVTETAARLAGEPETDSGVLRTIGRRLHAHLDGRNIKVRGTADNMSIDGDFALGRVTLDGLHVPDVTASCSFTHEATPEKRVFETTIHELALREKGIELTAEGNVTVSGRAEERPAPPEPRPVQVAWLGSFPAELVAAEPLASADVPATQTVSADLRLYGRDVDVQWLAGWLPVDIGMGGALRFEAELWGDLRKPSIDIPHLQLDVWDSSDEEGQAVDGEAESEAPGPDDEDQIAHSPPVATVYAQNFRLRPGGIELGSIALSFDPESEDVAIYGELPFSWERQVGARDIGWPFSRWSWLAEHLPENEEVSVNVELKPTDPNIFIAVVDAVRLAIARAGAGAREEPASAVSQPAEPSASADLDDATESVTVCVDSGQRFTEYCPRVRTEEFAWNEAPLHWCKMHRALAETLELAGSVEGALRIGGTATHPDFKDASLRLENVRISAPDGPSTVTGMRGEMAYRASTAESPSHIALSGFSADAQGLRALADGTVETARLLSDGFGMAKQEFTTRLMGPWVVVGDPWAGARVLTTLPRRWRYRRWDDSADVTQNWSSPELDDGDWDEMAASGDRPAVDSEEVIWYRTRFRGPRSGKERHLALAIDSMSHKAELFVNGRSVDRYLPWMPRAKPPGFGDDRPGTAAAEQPPVATDSDEESVEQRWAVDVTDFVTAGEENTIALRLTTVRPGQLPRPGPVRLGEMRGFVIRNIAGVITAGRDSPGEPLLIRVGGVSAEGVDADHVSADIGTGKVRLWGGIEVANDRFKLAELGRNRIDLSLAVDDITPRYAPYLLRGRAASVGPIRITASGKGENAKVRGRVRLERARVSLPAGGGGGGGGETRSVPMTFPQPEFRLAMDIGRDVHFVTPPLQLSSAGATGGGVPLTIKAPLPLRETRDALVVEGTPYRPRVTLDTELARNVEFTPPGGGTITIRQTAIGFDLAAEPGVKDNPESGEGLPLAGRILAYIKGVRNMEGASFSFLLVSPEYRNGHPEVLYEYEDVLDAGAGMPLRGGEQREENWILATQPARIDDRGTRELLALAFWPLGNVAQDGDVGVGEVALAWATQQAVGRLEAQILDPIQSLLMETGLVDRVTIQGVVAGVPSFQVGKDIIDNLYVSYQRQFTTRQEEGLQPPFTFSAAYRVRDKYDISFTTDERRDQRVSVEWRLPY
jgi:hypothetical protein